MTPLVLNLQDRLFTQAWGKGFSPTNQETREQARIGDIINQRYADRQEPWAPLQPIDVERKESSWVWDAALDLLEPGPLPMWPQQHPAMAGNRPSRDQYYIIAPPNTKHVHAREHIPLSWKDDPQARDPPRFEMFPQMIMRDSDYRMYEYRALRMLMALPCWYSVRSLRQAISEFRKYNPTMSITSGVYDHHRRRVWDRDRRTLAMVFFIPGVYPAFRKWCGHCMDLLNFRATSRTATVTINKLEMRKGDRLASMNAATWLAHIANYIDEIEEELWINWCQEAWKIGHPGIWEFEQDTHEAKIWDKYDNSYGFPTQHDNGSLAAKYLDLSSSESSSGSRSTLPVAQIQDEVPGAALTPPRTLHPSDEEYSPSPPLSLPTNAYPTPPGHWMSSGDEGFGSTDDEGWRGFRRLEQLMEGHESNWEWGSP